MSEFVKSVLCFALNNDFILSESFIDIKCEVVTANKECAFIDGNHYETVQCDKELMSFGKEKIGVQN